LTEDYDLGFRMHRLGFRQKFLPIRFQDGQPVATREYFPQRFRQAVRQRTRWVIGIALQGWERHGWSGGVAAVYWFWRDRKGLVGNPLSLLGNLICFYGLATWLGCRLSGQAWGLRQVTFGPVARLMLALALLSQTHRMVVRMSCSARLYGWAFAAGAPVRAVWANWLNGIATLRAIARYARASLARQPHVWLKTDHIYPALESPLGAAELVLEDVDLGLVSRLAVRALPRQIVERWKVLPFKVSEGQMLLATTAMPTKSLEARLRRHTWLEVRFQLVSPANFEKLRRQSL
jgi:adsorption protein B